ncbi:MAG: hypothetical protein JRJ06_01405 [Deltaproteobacteria bacterium]|nr:hypothetical protein [Deltaproteobacteria bacterium]
MSSTDISLCFPDGMKSCFACCPPIRSAGYEHIRYRGIIRRILRENTGHFNREVKIVPITGFSCWALGYLDKEYRLIGCLLHPAANDGKDLRHRVDYGDKCRRETCQEAKKFSELGSDTQRFWLHLSDGLDSFAYSSREINPLFRIMGWGTCLLRHIASKDVGWRFTRKSFFRAYPFFSTEISPRGNVYLIDRLVHEKGLHILSDDSFRTEFEKFSHRISERIGQKFTEKSNEPYVHLLGLDPAYSDLLRLLARITRIGMEGAELLKQIVDNELKIFLQRI